LETLEWLTGKPKNTMGLDEESLFLSRGQVKLCARFRCRARSTA
jgi:hypothetical protein